MKSKLAAAYAPADGLPHCFHARACAHCTAGGGRGSMARVPKSRSIPPCCHNADNGSEENPNGRWKGHMNWTSKFQNHRSCASRGRGTETTGSMANKCSTGGPFYGEKHNYLCQCGPVAQERSRDEHKHRQNARAHTNKEKKLSKGLRIPCGQASRGFGKMAHATWR